MLDHAQQARIGSKQILPEVGAALDKELLILAVGDLPQTPHQQPVAIVLNQAVPITAPDDLDYVPSGAAENRLEFLNDLAVAAHRPVEPLQVAVDDPDKIVEFFARRKRDGSERLWLVH